MHLKNQANCVFVAKMPLFEHKIFQVAPDTKPKTQAAHWLTHTDVQKH